MTKISDALRFMEGEEPARSPVERTPRTTGLLAPARRARPAERGEIGESVERDLLSLRTTVETLLPAQANRSLAFASFRGGEGTTTVLTAFAHLLGSDQAQTVAMVDANVLRPRLAMLHGAEQTPGLVDVLGGAAVSSALCGVDARTHLLPAGHGDVRHLRPETGAIDRVLAAFGGYTYTLLDCAPILAWPQGAACAAAVDGVVLVVEWGRTKREVVQRGIEVLTAARARILGVVLNRRRYPIPEAIYRRV